MKFIIKHEIEGRIRVHFAQNRMTYVEADTLLYYLENLEFVKKAKVYEQTADAAIVYVGERDNVITALREFKYEKVAVPKGIIESSGRALNAEYKEKLIRKVAFRALSRLFVPSPLRSLYAVFKSVGYFKQGLKRLIKGKLEVPVLDAAAIGASMLKGDFKTSASIMFLLGIGELLEEWTHKKSVGDLARSMSLGVGKVWRIRGHKEELVEVYDVRPGDDVAVHMGAVIPFDGIVISGEAMVNQSSLTGESVSVKKETDGYAYAGTVVEEGELIIRVKETAGSTKYEKIVEMIEGTEKLKSAVESKAEHLADKLVPYTLMGTVVSYLVTRNITRALSALMVDFSCALKLAIPITVLSAIREAGTHKITVKGGKYLEALAEADVVVFDKTGTLTKARPTVVDVIPFGDESADESLRIAACLEEHFPHSMAKAVVKAAKDKKLEHEEMHSKVDYVVAHGIASYIGEKRVIIGSYHFVFEDEGCAVRDEYTERFENLPDEYSHLYLAVDGELTAVICIADPLREEAKETIESLKSEGFKKVVMMTGDNERTASAIAGRLGLDEYYSEVLPEDKSNFILKAKENGSKVVMVGDGINDSPALSASDVGIAISDGAELAREIADITIAADDLRELIVLKRIAKAMMRRIGGNYRSILGINGTLIALGVGGVIQPTTSAMLHNASTLAIGLRSMKNLLP